MKVMFSIFFIMLDSLEKSILPEILIRSNAFLCTTFFFLAYATKNNKGTCRLGVSIPKSKIKKATERNKLKRVIRHQFLELESSAIDIVIVYRGTANKYDAKLISSSLQFHKKNIIKTTEQDWKTSE